MSDHEAHALDALRRLDGPAELDDDVEARIEAEVLARFDDRVAAVPIANDGPTAIVALEDARDRPGHGPARSVAMALGAAAAVLVVAGILVTSVRDDPGLLSPPASRPSTTMSSTTFPPVDAIALDAQLAAFCTSYIAPLRAADDVWLPAGASSEPRVDVLIAAEQAAQAMSELDPPLGDRLALHAEETLAAVTDARLADTLDEPDADDAILDAVDAVLDALSLSGAPQLPETCLP